MNILNIILLVVNLIMCAIWFGIFLFFIKLPEDITEVHHEKNK